MSQTTGATRSPTRLPHQPTRLLWAYLGLTFALAWAAWMPAAALFRDPHRPGLPSGTGGLFVLPTLGAADPTLAACLVLRVSGRRDLLGWLPSSALLEEFGWRGLALPLLQRRWNALTASVVLGLVWGVWHLPLMVANGEPPIPYLLLIVPHTMLMTWVVNSTRGSMLLAAAVLVRYGPRDLARRDRVQLAERWRPCARSACGPHAGMMRGC